LLRRWRASLIDGLIDGLPDTDIHVVARVAGGPSRSDARVEVGRPLADDLLRACAPPRRRGTLRVYLGYAQGVGTTTAMLQEARRREQRGTDVVVAAGRTSARPEREGALRGLELLGGPSGAAAQDRLDVDALLGRNPEVACVDDLAGLDVAGRTRAGVIPRIVEAGITVIATLHLADLESIRRAMGSVLGHAGDRPAVGDEVLEMADEMELVDVTPSVLDERLRRGEILPPAEAARALQGDFRPEVLATLREAAFRLIAEHTDRQLVVYMHERRIDRPWEARSRVMACVPPRPHMEGLIRRAAQLAERTGAQLRVVTVRTRPRSDAEKERLGEYATITHQLGGEFVTLYDRAVAPALAADARKSLTTELLLTRGRGRGHWSRGPLRRLIRMLTDVDVHILAATSDAQVTAAGRLNATEVPTPSGASSIQTRPA
jgi:two-component system sensor histidine kinase KdpD